MARVKKEKEKSLADAQEEIDAYYGKRGLAAAEVLLDVAQNSEDDRARVQAASKILDYVRPPKTGPMVQVNLPTVVSRLGLPEGPAIEIHQGENAKRLAIPPKQPPKILPEGHPGSGFARSQFKPEEAASLEPQPSRIPVPEKAAPFDPRATGPLAKDPSAPAKPPAARTVRRTDF